MLPLRTNLDGSLMPIRHASVQRVCTPDEMCFFFKNCFSPKERKFKCILLLQLGCECRIKEACAVNLNDFVKGKDYRELKMLIQKKVKTVTLPDGSQKRTGENVIEHKVMPEAIASHVRSWISDNMMWILESGGYIFPPSKMQKNCLFTPVLVMTRWFSKKRNQLIQMFPDRGFDRVIGQRRYKHGIKNMRSKKSETENLYMWATHLMKRFAGTYTYLFTKDLIFTQKMLGHEKPDTTQKHYIDGTFVVAEREKIKNKIFDQKFYEAITQDNNQTPAVWDTGITAIGNEQRQIKSQMCVQKKVEVIQTPEGIIKRSECNIIESETAIIPRPTRNQITQEEPPKPVIKVKNRY